MRYVLVVPYFNKRTPFIPVLRMVQGLLAPKILLLTIYHTKARKGIGKSPSYSFCQQVSPPLGILTRILTLFIFLRVRKAQSVKPYDKKKEFDEAFLYPQPRDHLKQLKKRTNSCFSFLLFTLPAPQLSKTAKKENKAKLFKF